MSSAQPQARVQADDFDDSDPTYTHFQHRAEFASLLARFLAIDVGAAPTPAEDKDEVSLVTQLGGILDYYLPMPGLLDPALDDIVPPLMAELSTALEGLASGSATPSAARLARLGRAVNWIVKVRGWKAVVPHFPSALGHLHVLITLLAPSSSGSHHALLSTDDAWELRAVLLLWLALLLTVPFSLVALSSDDSVTTGLDVPTHNRLFAAPTSDLAARVILLSLPLLHRPGREGEYTALVLARLLARDDAVQGLPGFLDWAGAELSEGEREREANLVTSLFAFLAVLPAMIDPSHLSTLSQFYEHILIPHLAGGATAASSGLIRKLAVKARGRWWLARLGRGLRDAPGDDLPEGIEEVLDDLMTALSDKDTIVRYSAAKYLARISALLPPELAEEIVGATIALFAGTDDEPVIETDFGIIVDPGGSAAGAGAMGLGGTEASRGEARWHGVCLAVAEMARRGLLAAESVADVVPWVVKALTFDLRRASHSVGANVRDAGAYVLWSLSRATPPEQLAPFANRMATTLIAASTLDREVGVRRAASAAFQEGVGRLGLYPEGIDVLAKTDFYSVSVRRKAFSVAAPAVATHTVYREALREHLHNITLRHWDGPMRVLGAQTLVALLQLDPAKMDDSVTRELSFIPALDPTSAHGALLALAAMAPLLDGARRDELVDSLAKVRAASLITSNAADIIAAGCGLVTAALTSSSDFGPAQRFLDAAERRREPEVHEALAAAAGRYSEVYDQVTVTAFTKSAVEHLASARPTQRQANALVLGHIVYCDSAAASAPLGALLRLLDPSAKADVETRRNAVRSLADLATQSPGGKLLLDASLFLSVVKALTASLEDYATDQRGDVGSWVRSAAVRSLARVLVAASTTPSTEALTRVPQDAFAAAMGGIAKQAMEKLDIVRTASTQAWGDLLTANADSIWSWPGARCMLDDGVMSSDWFDRGLDLLKTPARATMLAGLVQTAGSAVHSSSDRAALPLTRWLSAQPDGATYMAVLTDLCNLLATNLGSNRVAVPTLVTLARLFATVRPPSSQEMRVYSRALALSTRGIASLKSIDRITAALRVVTACLQLSFGEVRKAAAAALPGFLGHRFPRIRAAAAEGVYLALEELRDGGEAGKEIEPELEDALLETSWAEDVDKDAVTTVARLVGEAVE